MFNKKAFEFLNVTNRPVIPFLIHHIAHQIFLCPNDIGKCTISILPSAEFLKQPGLLYMVGRCQFNILHQISNSNSWVHMGNNVQMIFQTSYAVWVAFFVLQQSGDITI